MKHQFTSIILFTSITVLFSQAGQLDSSFNNTGKVITSFEGQSLEGNSILIQPDGKILLAGKSTSSATASDFVITRYHPNGQMDETFNDKGQVTIDFFGRNDFCNDMALQSDGNIIMTGTTVTLSGGTKTALVRLNADGSFDDSFGSNGISVSDLANSSEAAQAVLIQEDGKILVTGSVTTFSPFQTKCSLMKYHEDGTLDQEFGDLGRATASVPMGYNANFGILQADGKIITGGFLLENETHPIMLRFHPDGMLDNMFGTNGIVITDFTGDFEFARSIALQADNKILLAIGTTISGGFDFGLARYNQNGSLDNSFGNNGKVITDFSQLQNTAHDIAIQGDQKILLAGFVGTSPNHNFAIARYNTDGTLDSEFGTGGKVVTDFGKDDLAFAITIQQDKKIIAAGHSFAQPDSGDFVLARYFSGLEIVGTNEPALARGNLSLFPNPSSDVAILKYSLFKDQWINISLFDMNGKMLQNFVSKQIRLKGSHQEYLKFDIDIPFGHYTLVIENANSKTAINVVIE